MNEPAVAGAAPLAIGASWAPANQQEEDLI